MFDRTRDDENDAELNLAPLIDCVFLLLIFFLVATTLKQTEQELPVNLPQAVSARVAVDTTDPLVVGIDATGRLHLGARPVTTDALHRTLREAAAATPDRRVRIDFDEATPGRAIVQVLDLVNFEGFEHVGIHIAPDDAKQR